VGRRVDMRKRTQETGQREKGRKQREVWTKKRGVAERGSGDLSDKKRGGGGTTGCGGGGAAVRHRETEWRGRRGKRYKELNRAATKGGWGFLWVVLGVGRGGGGGGGWCH